MQQLKASKHESYVLFTIIAALIPIAGFLLGIIYLAKNNKLDRKLGEHTLSFSILFMILSWGILILW